MAADDDTVLAIRFRLRVVVHRRKTCNKALLSLSSSTSTGFSPLVAMKLLQQTPKSICIYNNIVIRRQTELHTLKAARQRFGYNDEVEVHCETPVILMPMT